MINFNINNFFENNKKNINSKNFLQTQWTEIYHVEKIMNLFNENLKQLSDPTKIYNDISIFEKKDKEFFTLDQCVSSSRYKPHNQNFNKKYDFVFSGCSETNGDFITDAPHKSNHEYNWGQIVSNKYNVEGLNLALQGLSVESIVKGLMNHFRKNGNPKVLLLLLPELGRLDFVVNNKIKIDGESNNSFENIIQQYTLFPWEDYDFKKISKAPHNYRDVIPYLQGLYRSLQSLLILDTYCKSAGIYFKYSSWSLASNFILKSLKDNNLEEYQNYLEGDFFNWSSYSNEFLQLNCHLGHEKDPLWNVGSDGKHMGRHRHLHIAERFIEEIEKDHPWN